MGNTGTTFWGASALALILVAGSGAAEAQVVTLDSSFQTSATPYDFNQSGTNVLGAVQDVTINRPLVIPAGPPAPFPAGPYPSAFIQTNGYSITVASPLSVTPELGFTQGTLVLDGNNNGVPVIWTTNHVDPNLTLEMGCFFVGYCTPPGATGFPQPVVVNNGVLPGTIFQNGSLTLNYTSTYTYAGQLNGAFSESQFNWLGTLTVNSGQFVDTGLIDETAVTVSPGATLQIGNGGAAAGFSGATYDANCCGLTNVLLTNNSTLIFDTSSNIQTPVVSGSGSVIQEGTGTTTITFTSNLSPTGQIEVLAGTLRVAPDRLQPNAGVVLNASNLTVAQGATLDLGPAQILNNLALGGTLQFDSSQTYAATISGNGSVVMNAPLIVFAGTNTYTGSTTINSGATLQLGTGGPFGTVTGPVIDNGTLTVDNSGTLSLGLSGTGNLINQGSGTTILTAANSLRNAIISAGSVQFGQNGQDASLPSSIVNNANVVFDNVGTMTYAGSLSGSGAYQNIGTGTLILDGQNPANGSMTLSAGTTIIGDDSNPQANYGGSVVVNAGAALKGHGTIVGNVTNNGVVEPGGSIGTLTVGSYTQSSAGTLVIDIAPIGVSKLVVGGQANLAGKLNLDFLANTPPSGTYPILMASQISGSFSQITTTNLPKSLVYGIQSSSTAISLVLPSGQSGLVIEPAIAAQVYSDEESVNLNTAEDLNDSIMSHLDTRYCLPAELDKSIREPSCPVFSVWRQARAGVNGFSGPGDAFNERWINALGGLDFQLSHRLALGLVALYQRSALSVNDAGGSVQTDSFGVSIYGSYAFLGGRVGIDALWVLSRGDATRSLVSNNGTVDLIGRPQSEAYGGSAQYSHVVCFDDVSALVRFSFLSLNTQSFGEGGSAIYGFNILSNDNQAAYGDLGLRYNHVFRLRTGAELVPEFGIAYRQFLDSQLPQAQFELGNVAPTVFTSTGAGRSREEGLVNFGVTAEGRNGYSLYLRGEGRVAPGYHEAIAALGGSLVF